MSTRIICSFLLLIPFFYISNSFAMENKEINTEGFFVGFDLTEKKFCNKALSENYHSKRKELIEQMRPLNQRVQRFNALNELLAKTDSEEQKSIAKALEDDITQDGLEQLIKNRSMSAIFLWLDQIDLNQPDKESLDNGFKSIIDTMSSFSKKNELDIVTDNKSPEQVERASVSVNRLLNLYNNLNVEQKLEEYLQSNKDGQICHFLGAFKAICGFSLREKKENKYVPNYALLEKAIPYLEKVLKYSNLSQEFRKEIREDIRVISYVLANSMYKTNPEIAHKYLAKLKQYSDLLSHKLELAYLILIHLAKISLLEEKEWAEKLLDEVAQNPALLEEQAIIFRNLAVYYEDGVEELGLEKDISKAQKYWKILADANFKGTKVEQIYIEACRSYAQYVKDEEYIAYCEKLLNCHSLEEDLKKELIKDLNNRHYHLGTKVYYDTDPEKAYEHLSKVVTYSNHLLLPKLELAYLVLIHLAKKSSLEDKQKAEKLFDEVAQNPELLERYAIIFRNLAFHHEYGAQESGLEKNISKAQKYWKILADANFKNEDAKKILLEACDVYGKYLAKKYYLNLFDPQQSADTHNDSPEKYFEKLILFNDIRGYLGLGLCHYSNGNYQDALECFGKVIESLDGILKKPLVPNQSDEETDKLSIALWCSGTILFAEKIPGKKNDGISLMHKALEKLPISHSLSFLLRETREDFLKKLYAVYSTDKSKLQEQDSRLLYIVGRLLVMEEGSDQQGLECLNLALKKDHPWSQLYLGLESISGERLNERTFRLIDVCKKGVNKDCVEVAKFNLDRYAKAGLLNALLYLITSKYDEGGKPAVDEWLSNLDIFKLDPERLFLNINEKIDPRVILKDENLYNLIMNDESLKVRGFKALVTMNIDIHNGLSLGEKLLPELRKVSKENGDMWQQFLVLARMERARENLWEKKVKLYDKIMDDFCFLSKNGNKIGDLGIALLILTEQLAPDNAKKMLKKFVGVDLGKKSVKEYAQTKIDLVFKNISDLKFYEKHLGGAMLYDIAHYFAKKENKELAKKYAEISLKLEYKDAQKILDTINNKDHHLKAKKTPTEVIRVQVSEIKTVNPQTGKEEKKLNVPAMYYQAALQLLDGKDIPAGLNMLKELAKKERHFQSGVILLLKFFEGIAQLSQEEMNTFFIQVARGFLIIKKTNIPMKPEDMENFYKLVSIVNNCSKDSTNSEKQLQANAMIEYVVKSGIDMRIFTKK